MISLWKPQIKLSQVLAVAMQVAKGNLGPGEKVAEFEKELAMLCGKKIAVAVSSGTAALMLAIASLKLDRRRSVLFPAYTNLAGANAAKFLGYRVRLIDINLDTLCMNPNRLNLKNAGTAIFVNHNAYMGEDIAVVRSKCENAGVPLIEDSAQAIGLLGDSQNGPGAIGGFINTLSFSVPKLVTTGQGGAVLTDEEPVALMVRSMRDQGMDLRSDRLYRWHTRKGANFRMTAMQAAMGLSQLRNIKNLLAKRKKVQNWYSEKIKIYRYGQHSVWMPIYKAKSAQNAQKAIDALKLEDIVAARLYRPISMQKEFQTKTHYKNAVQASARCIYLPGSLSLRKGQIDKICAIVREADKG